MFKYLSMPKLVAFYLKEFSIDAEGNPSVLYKFIFCVLLPFVSPQFRRARFIALAIAECTQSRDQITRLIGKITGATFTFNARNEDYYLSYDGTDSEADFAYNGTADVPLVPYTAVANEGDAVIILNGASRDEVEAYLQLLIPFYVELKITYQ